MSNKLSYMILHYNRPYLLETNIHLVRQFAPPGTQIVVADDGSDSEVVKAIKKMPIDDLYTHKKNTNTNKLGTCSDTYAKGRDLCKRDFFFFSEDDFFLSATPIITIKGAGPRQVADNVFFKPSTQNIFEQSMKLLDNNHKIHNVQLGRSHDLLQENTRSFVQDGLEWWWLDHSKKGGCYYCNWPNMSRTKEHKRVKFVDDISIWSLEGRMAGEWDAIYGKGDWAVIPPNRYYHHVGTIYSQRLDSFGGRVVNRQVSVVAFQKRIFGEVLYTTLEGFNNFILTAWKNGSFRLDPEQVVEAGLDEAFGSAYDRLKESIGGK